MYETILSEDGQRPKVLPIRRTYQYLLQYCHPRALNCDTLSKNEGSLAILKEIRHRVLCQF
jgi:hypothetical protein